MSVISKNNNPNSNVNQETTEQVETKPRPKVKQEKIEQNKEKEKPQNIKQGSSNNNPSTQQDNPPQEQRIAIPLSQYNALLKTSDTAFMLAMKCQTLMDEILGASLNFNGYVYNKNKELKDLLKIKENNQ